MDGPVSHLLDRYGTGSYLEKNAQPPAVQIAASVLGFGAMMGDRKHQQELMAEAEAMNQVSRVLEAKKMSPAIDALGGAPADTGFISHEAPRGMETGFNDALFKGGEAAGKLMAKQASSELTEMDKEAIIGMLGRGLAAAGKGMRSAGLGLRTGFGATGRMARAGADDVAQFASAVKPSLRQQAGGALSSAGRGVQRAGIGLQRSAGSVSAAAPKSKPLMSLGTKAKLLGGAAVLGTGYAGYKALQTGRDYMMQPTYSSSEWGHKAPLKMQPTAWGY